MVLPSVTPGSSVTMNVEGELREVTRVWTLTLPNSVTRAVGIASVNARNSSGDGLSWIFLAAMVSPRDVDRPGGGAILSVLASPPAFLPPGLRATAPAGRYRECS